MRVEYFLLKLSIFKLKTLNLLLIAILNRLISFGVLPGKRLFHHPIQLHPKFAYLIFKTKIFTTFFLKIGLTCIKLGLNESKLCFSSLTGLFKEDPGLIALFNLSPQLGELQFKSVNGAVLFFNFILASDEILKLLLI